MLSDVATVATVRFWNSDEGWGVIDSDATPQGCWAHFSHVAVPGYRALAAGQTVELEWESRGQDGYAFRALRIWPHGDKPYVESRRHDQDSAYRSTVTITFEGEQLD